MARPSLPCRFGPPTPSEAEDTVHAATDPVPGHPLPLHVAGGAASGDGPGDQPDPGGDRDARQGRDAHRDARVPGRRADRGDRREGLRHARFHPRAERLQQQLPRRLGVRDPQGLPQHRRAGQHGRHLLRADGREVAVPHGQRRHRLLPGGRRSDEGPDGDRTAAEGARHHQRHVVLVGDRHRLPRPRSRRGRQVPDRSAGLRRPAAGRRLLRRALEDHAGPLRRPLVPGRRRSEAGRRADQEDDQDLPVHAGRRRDEHRDRARGQGPARTRARRSPRPSSSRRAGRRSTRSRPATTRSSR